MSQASLTLVNFHKLQTKDPLAKTLIIITCRTLHYSRNLYSIKRHLLNTAPGHLYHLHFINQLHAERPCHKNMYIKKAVFLNRYDSARVNLQEELFRCWSRSVWSSPNNLSIFCFLPCSTRILLKSCAFSSDKCSDTEEFLLCEISLVSERLSACLLLSGTDCVWREKKKKKE